MIVSKTLVKNIFSLTSAEFVSRMLTFLFMAYLARVILTDGLGSISLGQYFAGFFMIFNAGLDTYSIKLASKNRENLASTFNEIFSARLILSIISYLLLAATVLLINKPEQVKFIILIVGLMVIAQINYINWVYMALEKFEIIAVRLIITSILNFSGILLFVRTVNDVWLAALIIVISQLLNAVWMIFYYIKKVNPIKLILNFNNFAYHIKKSIPINLTFMLIVFYNNIGMILVGLLVSTNYLYQNGILGAAIKLQLIAAIPVAILQQSFFPQLSRAETTEDKRELLNKFTKIMFLAGSIISVIVFFYSDILIRIAFGTAFSESGDILKILSIAVLMMFVNTSFSIPLIAWGREKSMVKIFGIAALVNLLINLTLIPYWGMYATAYASVATELVIFVFVIFLIRKATGNIFLQRLPANLITLLISFSLPIYILNMHFGIKFAISVFLTIILLSISNQFDISQLKELLKKKSLT